MMNMNVINPEAFIKAFEDMESGKVFAACIDSKDFEIQQHETKPLEGFELPEGFPDCCDTHRKVFAAGKEHYDRFPNCCEGHRKLNTAHWFAREDYAYMPMKLVTTYAYTMDCVKRSIDHDNWLKEITDYIEYTKSSYGQFPEGFGASLGKGFYVDFVEQSIRLHENIPAEKKARLLQYFQAEKESPAEEVTDLNLLVSKYKEWLSIFPFELSYFKELKSYFENQIPILQGKGNTNIYTGLTGFKVKSKKQLLDFLTAATLHILQEINALKLYQSGELTCVVDKELEILLAKRKLELTELDPGDQPDKRVYIKLLKKWIKGEKVFLGQLKPLLKQRFSFVHDMLDGMKLLQQLDTKEPCLENLRTKDERSESSFRDWFRVFFTARYPDATVTAEEEKGSGRIDLKVKHRLFDSKIVEFKGWWNSDKKSAAEQLCSYLTDFEDEGFIFMINHLRQKQIDSDYKTLMTQPSTNFVQGSWIEHKEGALQYYETKHRFSLKEKRVYHFILNVYF